MSGVIGDDAILGDENPEDAAAEQTFPNGENSHPAPDVRTF